MKTFIIGLLLAVVIIAGLTLVYFKTTAPKAEAFVQGEQSVSCTWGQIKVCMMGHCVPECCPENCKGID